MIAHPEENETIFRNLLSENKNNRLILGKRRSKTELFSKKNIPFFQEVNESPIHNQMINIQSLPRLNDKLTTSPYIRNDFPHWEPEIEKTRKRYGLPIPGDNKALKMRLPIIAKAGKGFVDNIENLKIVNVGNHEKELLLRNKMIEYQNLAENANNFRSNKSKQLNSLNIEFDFQVFSPCSTLDRSLSKNLSSKRKQNMWKFLNPARNEKYIDSINIFSPDRKSKSMNDNYCKIDLHQNLGITSLNSISPQLRSIKSYNKFFPLSDGKRMSKSREISPDKSSNNINISQHKFKNFEGELSLLPDKNRKNNFKHYLKVKISPRAISCSKSESKLSKMEKQIYMEKMRSLIKEKLQKRKNTFDKIMHTNIKRDIDGIASELKKFMVEKFIC